MSGGALITKWYLDVVSERGDAAVVYWAEWVNGTVRVRASGLVLATADRPPETQVRVTRAAAPEDVAERIVFEDASLGVSGEWRALRPAWAADLSPEGPGEVEWRCAQPVSDVMLRVRDRTIAGYGYAERIALRVHPWRLPIDVLRWGRVASAAHSVVWIDWRGPAPRTLALVDGKPAQAVSVADRGVEADGVRVALGEGRTIRAGAIGGVLATVPVVRRMARGWLRSVERKWVACATVTSPGGQTAKAWSIHERVEFGARE